MSGNRCEANDIIETIVSREKTDLVLPPAMVAFVILSYVAIVLSYLRTVIITYGRDVPAAQAFGISALYLIGNGLVLAFFYLLMTRNKRHSRRESHLRKSLLKYAESCNLSCGADLTTSIETLKSMDMEMDRKENLELSHGRIIYALIPMAFGSVILAAVDLTTNYVLVFSGLFIISIILLLAIAPSVTEFPRKHEMAAIDFAEEFHKIAPFLGISAKPHARTMGFRSFILFVILSVLTAGLFIALWAFLVFRDMNWHFIVQWSYEDGILRSIRDKENASLTQSDLPTYTLDGIFI